jgi:uncharacterized protein
MKAESESDLVARLLRDSRSIAVVGLSTDPGRPSYAVAAYLQRAGYRIIPVNPKAKVILGEICYPDVASIPHPVDLVDVFRRPEDLTAVARDAIEGGARAIWFQLGLIHPEAEDLARTAGLAVVSDRCLKIEHARLSGKLQCAGMNTGIISARRAVKPRPGGG